MTTETAAVYRDRQHCWLLALDAFAKAAKNLTTQWEALTQGEGSEMYPFSSSFEEINLAIQDWNYHQRVLFAGLPKSDAAPVPLHTCKHCAVPVSIIKDGDTEYSEFAGEWIHDTSHRRYFVCVGLKGLTAESPTVADGGSAPATAEDRTAIGNTPTCEDCDKALDKCECSDGRPTDICRNPKCDHMRSKHLKGKDACTDLDCGCLEFEEEFEH